MTSGGAVVDLAAVFAAIPGATPIDGLPDAWFWTHAPRFGNAAVLSRDRAHAFQCYANDSYDDGLARAVLAFAREHDTALVVPRPLVVAEGLTHAGYGFDTLVAFSPAVHRYHADEPEAHQATRAVCPAFRCEFSGEETEDEAAFRFLRASGALPTRWDREPSPYVRLRMRTASGRIIPQRGFADLAKLVLELTELPGRKDGFVEFENYERRVWTVTWQDRYVVDGHRIGFDELVEFVRDVLYGPNRVG
jgi:hypothetical protein